MKFQSVSLRDARRFVKLYDWFIKSISQRDNIEIDDNLKFKSILLSTYICYFIRLPTKEDKDKLYERLSPILKDIGYTIQKDKMWNSRTFKKK